MHFLRPSDIFSRCLARRTSRFARRSSLVKPGIISGAAISSRLSHYLWRCFVVSHADESAVPQFATVGPLDEGDLANQHRFKDGEHDLPRKRREILPSLRAEENRSMTIVENPRSPIDLPIFLSGGGIQSRSSCGRYSLLARIISMARRTTVGMARTSYARHMGSSTG
jgi:hypothetical protein